MVSPVLKWAGGKRWLVATGALPIPPFERYVEPFFGSGAVFFSIEPKKSLLSDSNGDLIHLYTTLRDHPNDLYKAMRRHHRNHDSDYYYRMRASRPTSAVGRAARMLYLNRTCWNGLYRVNLAGEFNVPVGTKSTVIFDDDDFGSVAQVLKGADIRCGDFEPIVASCGAGDFVFVDPPYTVKHNYNNFLKYNEKIFSWDDQVRLRNAVAGAIDRGASVAITNADHRSIRALYRDIADYRKLERFSVLAGDSAKRRLTTEALFCANPRM